MISGTVFSEAAFAIFLYLGTTLERRFSLDLLLTINNRQSAINYEGLRDVLRKRHPAIFSRLLFVPPLDGTPPLAVAVLC